MGVNDRVNLAGQAASRTPDILMIVVCDAGSVLMHAHDRGIESAPPRHGRQPARP